GGLGVGWEPPGWAGATLGGLGSTWGGSGRPAGGLPVALGALTPSPPLSPPPDAPRERPNSAVYPSESFRQSLLGPRRGRPSLSLSKSVSTTNIAGTFSDESALGIRRILSQSTDSLNVRNRTLSVESLIDEGGEGWGGDTGMWGQEDSGTWG
ncbi:rho guanine nucleotide exchange factor 2-like, partial [Phasianus colchicus]|uniref:rho guanine nucleotide exchange factor 2-like n=1 Tax=Phasianus colchicus TaxID=9054 RepID=UPI00129E8C75